MYRNIKKEKQFLMKRLVSFLLMSIVVLGLTGCDQVEEVVVTPQENGKIYIYSNNDEFKQDLDYVLESYPQVADKLEYIVPETDNYGEWIQSLLTNQNEEKYPDLIIASADEITRFTESPYTVSVEEIGITNQDCSQMYDFTKAAVTDSDGKLKALSGEIHPGAFIYRKALAKEYLGSDDPEDVQSYVQDWSTFEDTARSIYRKSEGKTSMLASTHALDRVFAGNRSGVWLENDEIVKVDSFDRLLESRFTLYSEKLSLNTDIDSSDYIKAASKNAVFGYFVTSDFVVGGLTESFDGMRSTLGYTGDWGVCNGPEAYADGGNWVFVVKGCDEKESVGKMLKEMYCDNTVLENMRSDKNAFVNNIKVMSNAYNTGKGKLACLGGADYIEVFDEQAKKTNLSNAGIKDGVLDELFFEIADDYVVKQSEKEKVWNDFFAKANEVLNATTAAKENEQSIDQNDNSTSEATDDQEVESNQEVTEE